MFKNNEDRVSAYKELFKSAHGEQVLNDLLKTFCKYGSDSFCKDPMYMAYTSGKQSVAIELLKFIKEEV